MTAEWPGADGPPYPQPNRWAIALEQLEEYERRVAAEREARRCKNCGWVADEPLSS